MFSSKYLNAFAGVIAVVAYGSIHSMGHSQEPPSAPPPIIKTQPKSTLPRIIPVQRTTSLPPVIVTQERSSLPLIIPTDNTATNNSAANDVAAHDEASPTPPPILNLKEKSSLPPIVGASEKSATTPPILAMDQQSSVPPIISANEPSSKTLPPIVDINKKSSQSPIVVAKEGTESLPPVIVAKDESQQPPIIENSDSTSPPPIVVSAEETAAMPRTVLVTNEVPARRLPPVIVSEEESASSTDLRNVEVGPPISLTPPPIVVTEMANDLAGDLHTPNTSEGVQGQGSALIRNIPPSMNRPNISKGFVDPRQFLVEAKDIPLVVKSMRQPSIQDLSAQIRDVDEWKPADIETVKRNPLGAALSTMQLTQQKAPAEDKEAKEKQLNLVFNPLQKYEVNADTASPIRENTFAVVETWESPNVHWRPLYYEEENLERYGHHYGMAQPAVSGIRFITNTAFLPYKIGAKPLRSCEYGLGYHRPGNCNPAYRHMDPFSVRGAVFQSTVGALLWIR